jgi:penicillin-binding protein 1A
MYIKIGSNYFEIDFKYIKRALIIAGIAIGVIIAGLIIYMVTVYVEFLINRDSIFATINEFSRELDKNNDSMIILGEDRLTETTPSFFLDRKGNIIAKYSSEKHKLIKLQYLPYYLTKGFVIVEDREFFNHSGINIIKLGQGIFMNIITLGHAPGGSTITQQLAKILFTKQKKTIKRKVYELYCTFELENKFTKNEILQIYLNSIYLGHGVYGVQDASQFYFGKDASELTIAEASILIGMNRAPELYSPIKYKDNAKRIQEVVLNQLAKKGLLNKEQKDQEIYRFWEKYNQYGSTGNQSFWRTEINMSGYLTEFIRQQIEKDISYEKITKGGIIVETTFDLERQMLAERVVKEQLVFIKNRLKGIYDKNKEANKTMEIDEKDINNLEAAFASIDYRTGEVLALVGGSGYSFANQFNRAVNAYRQIGSSVKPFIYGLALSNGKIGNDIPINPFSKFKDELKTYRINNKSYTPKNYDDPTHEYGNMVTLYDAVKMSLNTISIQVLNQMDIKSAADFIRNAAFLYSDEEKKRVPEYLSLGLGTCELSPLELATAYSVFARGGKNIYPLMIKKIYDSTGYVYYDYQRENNPMLNRLYPVEHRIPEELIRPEAAYEVVEMMRSVFEKGGTASWASYLTGLNTPAYGKSGTSQDFRDAWFAGFTDSEASAVWVGLDNNKSIYVPGAVSSAVIWCDYNQRVSPINTEAISIPQNMKLIKICMDTGLKAGKNCTNIRDFYFWVDGPKPEKCYIHNPEDDFDEDF